MTTATIAKTLTPIDAEGLRKLAEKGKSDPSQVRTVRCRTVAEGRFRHLNYVRELDALVVDEPPALLGDDTAPNPSEVGLAALGSCIAVGIHANAISRKLTITRLELELEADINITSVWGVGDLGEKPVGFTDVRVKVHLDADADRATLQKLIDHALAWSPVTGTFRNPVPVTATLA